MRLTRRAVLLALPALAAASARAEAPLPVVATFSILGDFVREVGGEAVEISVIVGPDGDAHVYEPTPADSKKLQRAKLVFVNGLGFEGWLDRLIAASKTKARIVVASEGVAAHFSLEMGTRHFPTFGFHGTWHLPRIYKDRLDWLLEKLPPRLLQNDAMYTLLGNEMYNVSASHYKKLTKLRGKANRGNGFPLWRADR